MKSLISSKQFTRESLEHLLYCAKQENRHFNFPTIMCTLFYQPSTRTRLSFESAMIRLGGHVISVENANESSSHLKRETLEDTIKTIDKYSDIIVLRHPDEKSSYIAAHCCKKAAVINAGSGNNEHPTQAIADIYTIEKHLGHVDDITVALVGDLTGRAVRSLVFLLGLFKKIRLICVSHHKLTLPADVVNFGNEKKIFIDQEENLRRALSMKPDVVYMTRSQGEISHGIVFSDKELEILKADAIIMHPFPRQYEITLSVDNDGRAVYFDQIENAILIRKSVLIRYEQKEVNWGKEVNW